MAKNQISSLLGMYKKALSDDCRDTEESIEILKAIVQFFIETNDEESAYNYQQKIIEYIRAHRSEFVDW